MKIGLREKKERTNDKFQRSRVMYAMQREGPEVQGRTCTVGFEEGEKGVEDVERKVGSCCGGWLKRRGRKRRTNVRKGEG